MRSSASIRRLPGHAPTVLSWIKVRVLAPWMEFTGYRSKNL
jgi:hypothetical protein